MSTPQEAREERGKTETSNHNNRKSRWHESSRVLIGVGAIIVTMIILIGFKFNLFWSLLTGIGLLVLSSQISKFGKSDDLKKLVWIWPGVTKSAGILVIVSSLLGSGLGRLAEHGVMKVETAAYCVVDANKSTEKCKTNFGGANTTLPTIESCTGAFGNALDCNQVTLKKDGESYKRMLPTAACTHWYPEENVEYRVSGSVLRLYTTAEEVTVSVYSVPIGESFNGEACNG